MLWTTHCIACRTAETEDNMYEHNRRHACTCERDPLLHKVSHQHNCK
jgi:hypothetical protein